jgi:hypothetical protein
LRALIEEKNLGESARRQVTAMVLVLRFS